MSAPLARRVAGFGTTIFTEMSALAVQHGAVNLGQGFPDFAGPEFVKQAAAAAIAADLNQYAPMPGLPRLRQAVAAQWERDYGRAVDWQTEVTVTSGATEALCGAALALLDPGDGRSSSSRPTTPMCPTSSWPARSRSRVKLHTATKTRRPKRRQGDRATIAIQDQCKPQLHLRSLRPSSFVFGPGGSTPTSCAPPSRAARS